MKLWEILSFAMATGILSIWTIFFFDMLGSPTQNFQWSEPNKIVLAIECVMLLYLTVFMGYQVYKGVKR